MKRSLRYNLVDVFTDTPLTGNPLAVFTRAEGLDDDTMQSIAREMNLSETVFFLPPKEGGHARLRIFTPRSELPFAGHPILGSAWVLGHPMEMGQLRLETGAGIIPVDLERDGGQLFRAWMTQPIPTLAPCPWTDELLNCLGTTPQNSSTDAATLAHNGPNHVLVDVGTAAQVDALSPDMTRLAQLTQAGVLAYAVDAATCVARYFAPAAGINEDPATGSANGPLGALLVQQGRLKSGERLTVTQGKAMLRPSLLLVEAHVSGDEIREVRVGGSAVVLGRGELIVR